ncbi:MAG: B12-binding domain-containing radical SAM protein [Planctomycetes bacterium]|nr:B12-binding domain-containing radical SAM protein [Planctomycetota bacterium]
MPHVAFVPLTGLRVREAELLDLGMSLPGLARRANALAELPALGLLTLAGMTPATWSCSYHDTATADEQLVERVLGESPDLVAISALTASVTEAYSLSDKLRARGISVVLGGLHATCEPDEAGLHCDSVVVGDGEPVWQQILDDATSGSVRPTYRAASVYDLADSPVPRFELLGERSRPRFTLQTERGCPLACDFCGASRLLGSFREKPVANIRDELAAINQIDPSPWLELADDNTFAGGRDTELLLSTIESANARFFTEADWRIGERPELLKQLAASGCVQVLLGIESLVFRYPGMGPKQSEFQRIMTAVDAIQDAGIVANGCFIVGADGETDESLDRLIKFILNSRLGEVQITLQTPFPGTALRRKLSIDGRLLADRDWSHYTLFDVTYRPDQISVKQLERGFRRVIRAVFDSAANKKRGELRKSIWRKNPRFRT